MKTWETELEEKQQCINAFLEKQFLAETPYSVLLEAMRYSLLSGGKRIRPVLTMAFAEACSGENRSDAALKAGCAIEMLHTYSLIHDDLPCMDDSDLRRGRPTCHKRYGYANALLAGDALQAAAFCTLSEISADASKLIACVHILASAAGENGMVGGQVLDLIGEHTSFDEQQLKMLSRLKTGALISAACQIGCILGGGKEEQIAAAKSYGEAIGLAFQIRDDVLDVIGSESSVGKSLGTDSRNGKNTFASVLGIDCCQERISELTASAVDVLVSGGFTRTDFLFQMANQLARRDK